MTHGVSWNGLQSKSSDCTRDRPPRTGIGRRMCKRPLKFTTWTHAYMFERLQFGAGRLNEIAHTSGNRFSVNLFDRVLHSHHIAAR